MKKSYMPISDVKNESTDLTKRLFRSISEVVRVLDDQKKKAVYVPDLFTKTNEAQRMKLRDYCERLMFTDPLSFGRKGEELLWRKGYYEVVTYAKKLHKGPIWKPLELCYLRSHLQAGIGHYHHLLLRLQLDFKLDLRGVVDFPLVAEDDRLKKGKSGSNRKELSLDTGVVEWASAAVHRSLIYLGDLGRYLTDLCPGYSSDLPARYYHQALQWKPECGMPHNQLGTLVGNNNFFLDSAYHYMRCLACVQSFEGTESNLSGVLERSYKHFESQMSPSLLHHLIAKFLNIVDFCYCEKHTVECFPQVCHEAITRLNSSDEMVQSSTMSNGVEGGNNQPQKLTDDILFKLTLVSIMCTQQLQDKGSEQMNTGLAVTLAMMNYLIVKVVERIEAVLPTPQPPPPPRLSNGHNKRRRRRRRRRHSSELSSDLSDEEIITISSDSDLSEEELVFDTQSLNSDSEEEADDKEDETVLDQRKVQLGETSALEKNPVLDHIEHLCQTGFLLQTIKICLDWLLNNTKVLKACDKTAKPMLNRTAMFLNHLALVPLPPPTSDQLNAINNDVLENEQIPLVEEVSVRGLLALKPAYQHIDWDQLKTISLTPRQEAYVRLCKLVKLGRKLANSEDTAITYDESRKWFQLDVAKPEINGLQETKIKTKITIKSKSPVLEQEKEKGQLMKDMGQLWLKAEVRELETKVRRTSPLPPYLVLDCDALTFHIALVKQLVHSKKFIILVPSVVVSSLDEQKRVCRRVRDTIRWLEAQFRQGNRFLRAQRSNEHLSLPLIKYPKKKDKEAWMFFQVAECCHYISQQNGTRPEKDNLVTLLTGSRSLLAPNINNGFSPLGIANTAGMSIEHIETFHGKWKTSTKSHG